MAERMSAPSVPQAGSSSGADSVPTPARSIAAPGGERARGDRRQRRALEGWLVSRMRTQARRRREAYNDRPPRGSRSARPATGEER